MRHTRQAQGGRTVEPSQQPSQGVFATTSSWSTRSAQGSMRSMRMRKLTLARRMNWLRVQPLTVAALYASRPVSRRMRACICCAVGRALSRSVMRQPPPPGVEISTGPLQPPTNRQSPGGEGIYALELASRALNFIWDSLRCIPTMPSAMVHRLCECTCMLSPHADTCTRAVAAYLHRSHYCVHGARQLYGDFGVAAKMEHHRRRVEHLALVRPCAAPPVQPHRR